MKRPLAFFLSLFIASSAGCKSISNSSNPKIINGEHVLNSTDKRAMEVAV